MLDVYITYRYQTVAPSLLSQLQASILITPPHRINEWFKLNIRCPQCVTGPLTPAHSVCALGQQQAGNMCHSQAAQRC